MSDISIEWANCGYKVMCDGVDISDIITELTVKCKAGDIPEIIIHMMPDNVMKVYMENAKITMALPKKI
jgi:hypothetical protein